MITEKMLNEMSDEEWDKEYDYTIKLARDFYHSFLENLAEEAESIKNLRGESTRQFFLDCVRDHFKNIDF